MDDEAFAERLALCQALPGPTSSQMAFACAWHMSGRLSLASVCLGLFLLPSMLILLALGLFFFAAASGGLGLNGLQAFMGHLSDWMVPLVIAVITHATRWRGHCLSRRTAADHHSRLRHRACLPLWDFGSLQVFAQPHRFCLALPWACCSCGSAGAQKSRQAHPAATPPPRRAHPTLLQHGHRPQAKAGHELTQARRSAPACSPSACSPSPACSPPRSRSFCSTWPGASAARRAL